MLLKRIESCKIVIIAVNFLYLSSVKHYLKVTVFVSLELVRLRYLKIYFKSSLGFVKCFKDFFASTYLFLLIKNTVVSCLTTVNIPIKKRTDNKAGMATKTLHD
jgi:hypothetical protein